MDVTYNPAQADGQAGVPDGLRLWGVTSEETVDVVLIGGGIMSATLGSLISRLQPDWSIRVYERLGRVAQWEGRVTCWVRTRLMRAVLPLVGAKGVTKFAAHDVGTLEPGA